MSSAQSGMSLVDIGTESGMGVGIFLSGWKLQSVPALAPGPSIFKPLWHFESLLGESEN
jgi:hypothetical protein